MPWQRLTSVQRAVLNDDVSGGGDVDGICVGAQGRADGRKGVDPHLLEPQYD